MQSQMPSGAPPWLQALPIVIPVIIFAVLMMRRMQPRPLNVNRLWIAPVTLSAVVVLPFVVTPPPLDPISILSILAAGALGCVVGFYRGRATIIAVDPVSHAVTAQVSPFGSLLLLAIFGVRYFGRTFLMQNASAWHISPLTLTDAFMVFAWGLVVVQRGEMWLRAQRLVTEAKSSTLAPLADASMDARSRAAVPPVQESGNPPIVQ